SRKTRRNSKRSSRKRTRTAIAPSPSRPSSARRAPAPRSNSRSFHHIEAARSTRAASSFVHRSSFDISDRRIPPVDDEFVSLSAPRFTIRRLSLPIRNLSLVRLHVQKRGNFNRREEWQ